MIIFWFFVFLLSVPYTAPRSSLAGKWFAPVSLLLIPSRKTHKTGRLVYWSPHNANISPAWSARVVSSLPPSSPPAAIESGQHRVRRLASSRSQLDSDGFSHTARKLCAGHARWNRTEKLPMVNRVSKQGFFQCGGIHLDMRCPVKVLYNSYSRL